MEFLTQWMPSHGKWTRSLYADLPELRHGDPAELQHWCAAAGGLALILSRAGSGELRNRFGATDALYRLLRRRLRQARRIDASAELLGDVMHEIAEVADPMTRASLNACFRACVRRPEEAQAASQQRAQPAPQGTTMQPLSSSLPPSTRLPALENSSRRFDHSEHLLERSSALRRTVAAARATNFAELR